MVEQLVKESNRKERSLLLILFATSGRPAQTNFAERFLILIDPFWFTYSTSFVSWTKQEAMYVCMDDPYCFHDESSAISMNKLIIHAASQGWESVSIFIYCVSIDVPDFFQILNGLPYDRNGDGLPEDLRRARSGTTRILFGRYINEGLCQPIITFPLN